MRRRTFTFLSCVTFAVAACAATDAPTTLPTTSPATQSSAGASTRPVLVQIFHGGPGHWCQVCAAAAARKAKENRPAGDAVVPGDAGVDPSGVDLITDLPPR